MSVLVGESVRYYAWDGWRNVVEAEHVYDGASPATWQAAPVKQFVWGAELDELVSYRRKVPTATVPAWETYYLLHGGQETAAKLVDANGEVVEQYEYDPYGRATVFSKVAGQWTSGVVSRYGLPFLWKAVRLDEVTGLLQMRNRYYSVETGRFLTRDPIGVWGDNLNLGNELTYAAGSPLCRNDNMGLITGDPRFLGAIDRAGWYCASDDDWRKERDRQVAEILAESARQYVEDSRADGKERGGVLVLDGDNRLYSVDAQTMGGVHPNFVDMWTPFREAVNMTDFEVVGTWHTHPKDPARPSTGDKFVQAGITGNKFDGLQPSRQAVDRKVGGPFDRLPGCSMFILGRPLGVHLSDKQVVVNSFPTNVTVPAK
jgi:RHS repeat-associated protein